MFLEINEKIQKKEQITIDYIYTLPHCGPYWMSTMPTEKNTHIHIIINDKGFIKWYIYMYSKWCRSKPKNKEKTNGNYHKKYTQNPYIDIYTYIDELLH